MRKSKYFISIGPDEGCVRLQDHVADEDLVEGQKQNMRMGLGNGTTANLRAIAKAIEKMADDIDAGMFADGHYEVRDIEGA